MEASICKATRFVKKKKQKKKTCLNMVSIPFLTSCLAVTLN